jgi:hypothetical protein
MHHGPVQRKEGHVVALECEAMEIPLAHPIDGLEPGDVHGGVYVGELTHGLVDESEHEPAPVFVRCNDDRVTEAQFGARPGEAGDNEAGNDHAHERSQQRLHHGERVRCGPHGMHAVHARRGKNAHAVDQRRTEGVIQAQGIAAGQRARPQ